MGYCVLVFAMRNYAHNSHHRHGFPFQGADPLHRREAKASARFMKKLAVAGRLNGLGGFVRLFRAARTHTLDAGLRRQVVSVVVPNLECGSAGVAIRFG